MHVGNQRDDHLVSDLESDSDDEVMERTVSSGYNHPWLSEF